MVAKLQRAGGKFGEIVLFPSGPTKEGPTPLKTLEHVSRRELELKKYFGGKRVQSCCDLKKNPFFEVLFAAPVGTLVRFAGPPGRHSRLNHRAVLNFYVENLGFR